MSTIEHTPTPAKSTHQLLMCSTLPAHWVVREHANQTLHIVPAIANGWNERKPYKGHVRSLEPVAGYCWMGLGVPIAREWSTVCQDASGNN